MIAYCYGLQTLSIACLTRLYSLTPLTDLEHAEQHMPPPWMYLLQIGIEINYIMFMFMFMLIYFKQVSQSVALTPD